MRVYLWVMALMLLMTQAGTAQLVKRQQAYTAADTLRGMLSPLRSCYDVNYYHLDISLDMENQAISGSNEFSFTALQNFDKLQFDLFSNLKVEQVIFKGQQLPFTRRFNAVFVTFPEPIEKGSREKFRVLYSGKPLIAKNPPWDGGFVFSKDKSGNPWVSVACQGLGASSWWPNKDHQSDEADSMLISISVPKDLQEISNGRLRSKVEKPDGYLQYNWFVGNPVNNYNVSFYMGRYAHWTDQYIGEKGVLTLDYWALQTDSAVARPHWDADVKPMLKCFEHWFGPYPFYKDGYKLVQAPYLGMEHQSAIAYGNGFKMGYLGDDLSCSGWGLKFDFITVHESGHEWFGNNMTSKDIADMWIHEAFTTYAEALFTEAKYGKKAAREYITGIRKNIKNDVPIIAAYNLNQEGSADMYYKGANLVHLIRQLIGNDEKFRAILRGLNKTFYHQTVSTQQVEGYISKQSGLNLQKVFDQYLRHASIPVLEFQISKGLLKYRWKTAVHNFNMPVKVTLRPGGFSLIRPSDSWQTIAISSSIDRKSFRADPDYYIGIKMVN